MNDMGLRSESIKYHKMFYHLEHVGTDFTKDLARGTIFPKWRLLPMTKLYLKRTLFSERTD